MTKNRKIKRLQKQNDSLIKQNIELRNKIPTAEYARKMDRDLDRFEDINDELLKLYHEMHVMKLKNKGTAFRYKFGVFKIKVRQFLGM